MLLIRSKIAARVACLLLVTGATLALAAPAAKQTQSRASPAASTAPIKGATVEGVTEYDYPNRFKLLLVPDPSKPTVTVNITYFVGSRHEGYGETGMAHLLEHMVFKGTPTTTNVPKALNDHGEAPDVPAVAQGEEFEATPQNLEARTTRITYGAASFISASPLDKEGSFGAFAIYAPENVSRLEKGFTEEVERAVKEGFTAEEVSQAKPAWLQSRQVSRAQDQAVAGTLTGYLYYDRTYNWDADLEAKVSALSAQQLSDALKRHLDPKKISVVKAGDFAKKKASAESVARPNQP